MIILSEYTKAQRVNPQSKRLLVVASLFVMTAIILGAMAANLLKGSLFPAELDTFKLAVRYQFWMGFSILMMVIIENVFLPSPSKLPWFLVVGGLFFSGSLYALVFLPAGASIRQIVGPITPIGGILMILGWGLFLIRIIRQQSVK